MKLSWSDLAKQELREIRRFSIGRWGVEVAYRYVADIRDAARTAALEPYQLPMLKGAFRVKRIRSHYLIFQIDTASGRMIVARILHSAMDLERHLQ